MARTKAQKEPRAFDVGVGARIRLRRKQIGLSQVQLAHTIGVTFQQIQKYELGKNRISISRLADIRSALRCGLSDLTGDLGCGHSLAMSQLLEPGAQELLHAYTSLTSRKCRDAILGFVKQLAAEQRRGRSTEPAPQGAS